MNETYIFLAGHGFDVHPLKTTNTETQIMVCGVPIPCCFELVAHSDGDVALHALTDALLGTIGAGDIGEHFPATNDRWKNKASSLFLSHALLLLKNADATLVNLDITIICEAPKISPFKLAMKNKLAELTGLPLHRINIKATTTEKLGFLGRGEGIAAQAVVSVKVP